MNEGRQPSDVELALEVARAGVVPPQPERLSRRNRSIILDADFYDDRFATVWLVRRGHSGTPADRTVDLERQGDGWHALGGGGSEPGEDLAWRPSLAEAAELQVHEGSSRCEIGLSTGGSRSHNKRPNAVRLVLATSVTELRISDGRTKSVPAHGRVTVLYDQRQPPTLHGYDKSGTLLGVYNPKDSWRPRPPRTGWRDAFDRWRWRRRG